MRITFREDLMYELAARGLDYRQAAELAGLCEITISSAAHGKQVNLATAVRLAKVLQSRAVIPELARCLVGHDPEATSHLEGDAR
ncbi:MAG: hypothetical protein ACYCZN_04690 [Candidatus Dormibacteria bacterium]